ncbi:MAG: ABC transporter ATP-binding protein/permease [Flavobacteriaceae bacterium]|jgi:subfamily B ATP-binding cassette protein MsbA|nr:ABC transporter ATP-binding protein/permease [Flavobacteriaceae bacterium]
MKSAFHHILKYAGPYKQSAYANVLFNMGYALFNVLSILIFIPTLGILFGTQPEVTEAPVYEGISSLKGYVEGNLNYRLTQESNANGPIRALLIIVVLSALIFFLKNLFRYLALYALASLRTGMVKDLQNDLYDQLIDLPIAYSSEKRKGDLLSRMTSDIKEIESAIINSLETLAREPLTILFVVFSMLAISWQLTLFVFIFLPITGFIIARVGKTLKAKSLEAQKESGLFLSFLEESLGGLKIIKAFTAESSVKAKFNTSTQRYRSTMNAVLRRNGMASPLSEFLGVCVVLSVLWYGGRLVLGTSYSLNPQQFLGYIGLFYTIINPVKSITTVNYNIKKGKASAERVLEVIQTVPTIKDPVSPKPFRFEESITFDDLNFAYDEQNVLNHLNLSITKGQMLALVGSSGSGKSTIAQLLLRFYDPPYGQLKIDDVAIQDFTKNDLRSHIALVSQDPLLFNDTVANNIALSNPNATEDQIIWAAKQAYAHEFVEAMPEGYQTSIGDSGNKLSGGQKQRIAIARAFLKNAPILILDEATSALDTESEKQVQKALEAISKDRTTIAIAHRLSTIINADQIVVLDHGQIAEKGTHQDLLAKKGLYAKLVALQSLS